MWCHTSALWEYLWASVSGTQGWHAYYGPGSGIFQSCFEGLRLASSSLHKLSVFHPSICQDSNCKPGFQLETYRGFCRELTASGRKTGLQEICLRIHYRSANTNGCKNSPQADTWQECLNHSSEENVLLGFNFHKHLLILCVCACENQTAIPSHINSKSDGHIIDWYYPRLFLRRCKFTAIKFMVAPGFLSGSGC